MIVNPVTLRPGQREVPFSAILQFSNKLTLSLQICAELHTVPCGVLEVPDYTHTNL